MNAERKISLNVQLARVTPCPPEPSVLVGFAVSDPVTGKTVYIDTFVPASTPESDLVNLAWTRLEPQVPQLVEAATISAPTQVLDLSLPSSSLPSSSLPSSSLPSIIEEES